MTTIFKTPFATQGDKTSIPVEIQPDGSVSYTQGYGYDYERDQVTDPAAKDIEREKMNGIFHDITEAIGEIQSFGFPKWDEAGKPYAIRTIVYHKNKVWQSKIENNNIEPVAGNAWVELKADATAGDVGAYSKTESEQRFQPLGNYQASGYGYSKAESDTKYQPKGNYAPAGSYANKGDSYTKTESDGRYQAKGNYQPVGNYALVGASYTKAESDGKYQPKGSYQPAGNYALVGASYTKKESDAIFARNDNVWSTTSSDARYQPKGNYATAGSSYTKAESDGRYQSKGNYQPAGNYALVGASYTKAESDSKYQPKGSYQASGYSYSKSESDGKYQPKGNYAIVGSSYTKAESDGRYEKKGTGKSWRKVGGAIDGNKTASVTEDVRGKTVYLKNNNSNDGWCIATFPPVDNIMINESHGGAGFIKMQTTGGGMKISASGSNYSNFSEIWLAD
ncbi:hypothetical protein [Proteus terrae]|uniref:hypothetical protein n=1 Tax=Proteus terrae TaxID=1574161 RepID=UPI0021510409|nr:hypothetical protein [Proteus terrae]